MNVETTSDDLRKMAQRLMKGDATYQKLIAQIGEQTMNDARKQLGRGANETQVQRLAEEMVIARMLAGARGRLTLGGMKKGKCDCCKWETALA